MRDETKTTERRRSMTDPMPDLTKMTSVEQAALLRTSVVEWNTAVAAARREQPSWRADLTGANLAGVQHGRALLWAWAEADAEGDDDA